MTDSAKKLVLYVEDEYYNYLVVEKMLKYHNIELLHVENGINAIKIFTEHPEINLVLMDIKIGSMDGITVTKELKKIRPDVKVIAITAYAFSGDKENLLNSGCDDYIAKPVKWNILTETINKYL